jgi:hypothetical protein
MPTYVYRAPVHDIEEKLTSHTGLVPTAIVSASTQDVGIMFPATLSSADKDHLDLFMRSRGMTFVRVDAAPPPRAWQDVKTNYRTEQYDPGGRLVRRTWYRDKVGGAFVDRRREQIYSYQTSTTKLLSIVDTLYLPGGTTSEAVRVSTYSTDRQSSVTLVHTETT